jgi:hypothetical protein
MYSECPGHAAQSMCVPQQVQVRQPTPSLGVHLCKKKQQQRTTQRVNVSICSQACSTALPLWRVGAHLRSAL